MRTAVEELSSEVRGLRLEVRGNKRARRQAVAGFAVAIAVLAGVVVAIRVDGLNNRYRNCVQNNKRSEAVVSFAGDLVDELAPPGSPSRTQGDAFVQKEAGRFPISACAHADVVPPRVLAAGGGALVLLAVYVFVRRRRSRRSRRAEPDPSVP